MLSSYQSESFPAPHVPNLPLTLLLLHVFFFLDIILTSLLVIFPFHLSIFCITKLVLVHRLLVLYFLLTFFLFICLSITFYTLCVGIFLCSFPFPHLNTGSCTPTFFSSPLLAFTAVSSYSRFQRNHEFHSPTYSYSLESFE